MQKPQIMTKLMSENILDSAAFLDRRHRKTFAPPISAAEIIFTQLRAFTPFLDPVLVFSNIRNGYTTIPYRFLHNKMG